MVLFTWTDEYEVGIPAIDKQHKKICNLANRLHDERAIGRGSEKVSGIVVDLIAYTQDHFEFELKHLAARGHHGITEHRLEHEALIRKVSGHALQLYDDPVKAAQSVTYTLRAWLFDHIRDCDVFAFREVQNHIKRAA